MSQLSAPSHGSPRLYRYRDAAAALGLSMSMVKRLVLKGAIASVLIGTARRIPDTEIERVAREGITV